MCKNAQSIRKGAQDADRREVGVGLNQIQGRWGCPSLQGRFRAELDLAHQDSPDPISRLIMPQIEKVKYPVPDSQGW